MTSKTKWTHALAAAIIGKVTPAKIALYNIINSPNLQRAFSFERVSSAAFPENHTRANVSLLAYDAVKNVTQKVPIIEIIVNLTPVPDTTPRNKKVIGEVIRLWEKEKKIVDDAFIVQSVTLRSLVPSMMFEKDYLEEDMTLVQDALDLMHCQRPIDLQKVPEIHCL